MMALSVQPRTARSLNRAYYGCGAAQSGTFGAISSGHRSGWGRPCSVLDGATNLQTTKGGLLGPPSCSALLLQGRTLPGGSGSCSGLDWPQSVLSGTSPAQLGAGIEERFGGTEPFLARRSSDHAQPQRGLRVSFCSADDRICCSGGGT
jgi:hypothetical protein